MMMNNYLLLILNLLITVDCGEISQRKCDEYKDYAYRITSCSLAIGTKRKCARILNCNPSIPLIVGGTKARKHEFPHFALIGYGGDDREHFKCGGSIISEKYILTASHCKFTSDGQEATLVRVGEHLFKVSNGFRKDYEIQEFIRHKEYDPQAFLHDIALVKVKDFIKFSFFVRPACLHQHKEEMLKGQSVIAIGFGALGHAEESSDVFMKVNLTVVHPRECRGILENTQSQICVKGDLKETGEYADTCQGDSGGPIQKRQLDNNCTFDLIGITSFGKICGSGDGAVYTRIANYLSWIEKTVWNGN